MSAYLEMNARDGVALPNYEKPSDTLVDVCFNLKCHGQCSARALFSDMQNIWCFA